MLQVRLSKLNIYTRPFKEKNDEIEHIIIFSCRKCMGVKLNVNLFNIIRAERWDLLPDELFTLLLYYEMILHHNPDELADFYDFRALVAGHMTIDAPQVISVEGLGAALDLYEKETTEQKMVRITVTLRDSNAVMPFLNLLRQVAASDTIIVKHITVNLGSPVVINDKVLLSRLQAFSKKVPLNFRLIEENYALAGELYDILLENEIWGDYFFDLNEYTTVQVPDGPGLQHLPLAIKMKALPRELLSRLNSCIEKMIFIKYKVWPQ